MGKAVKEPEPSLLSGMARLPDFFGTYAEAVDRADFESDPHIADLKAIASDWDRVADDLSQALASVRREIAAERESESLSLVEPSQSHLEPALQLDRTSVSR